MGPGRHVFYLFICLVLIHNHNSDHFNLALKLNVICFKYYSGQQKKVNLAHFQHMANPRPIKSINVFWGSKLAEGPSVGLSTMTSINI